MTGPTTTGSIDAKLTVDDSDFKRGMAEAKADAKEVGALTPTVKVDANVGAALAKLDAVALAERNLDVAYQRSAISQEKLSQISKKYGEDSAQAAGARLAMSRATNAESDAEAKLAGQRHQSTDETNRNTEATKRGTQANQQNVSGIAVLIGMAPAILAASAPIAAAAVGLGAAFGVMGVSGVLAIKGIKDAMEIGDTVGNTYATGIGALKGNLDQLAATSANGMLGGFNRAVADINTHMPFLTQITGQFAGILGQIGSTALRGVLDGLQQMNPLLQAGGIELSKFVTWLTSFTSSNGFSEFISYATANLPSVMHLIESLVTLAGHILAAFAPLGPVVVTVLTAISDGLSSLPLPILAGVVSTLTTLSPALKIAGTAMEWFGVESSLAVPVVGILLAALTGLGIAAASAAQGTDTGTQSFQDYTQALKDDNEALGEHVRLQAAKALSDAGAYDAARTLGVSQKDLTDALMGVSGAQDKVNTAIQRGRDFQNDWSQGIVDSSTGIYIATDAQNGMGKAIDTVNKTLGTQRSSMERGKQINADMAASTNEQTKAAQAQADQYGVTVGMYQTATAAQQKTADQLAMTTLNMQLQGDAAGLLKQAFDALNGKTLGVEQAQTQAAAASNSAAKSFKQNGLAITGTTDAAIANKQALQNKVVADQAAAAAIAKSTGSTEAGTKAFGASKKALEDQLRAQGALTPAIQAYINKIYAVPKVAPTKLEIQKAAAEAALALWKQEVAAATARRTQYIDVITNRIEKSTKDPAGSGSSVGGRQNGSLAGGAATGGLIHAGFSASSPAYLSEGGSPFVPRGTDTIPAMLTPGEIVMKRASVQSIGEGTLLEANRTGKLPSQGNAGGGGVHIENLGIYEQQDPNATVMAFTRRMRLLTP